MIRMICFLSGPDFSLNATAQDISGLESLREDSVLQEGHGFSRAVSDTAIPGFSH